MDTIMNSDHDSSEEEVVMVSTPKKSMKTREPSAPPSVFQHQPREPLQQVADGRQRAKSSSADSGNKVAVVMVSGPARPWEYQAFDHSTTVDEVLGEIEGPDGEVWYKVQYEDGNSENVSFDNLLKLRNGSNALGFYNKGDSDDVADSADSGDQDQSGMSSSVGKRNRVQTERAGYVDSGTAQIDSEASESGQLLSGRAFKRRRLEKGRIQDLTTSQTRQSSRISSRQSSRKIQDDDDSDSDQEPEIRQSTRQSKAPSRRRLTRSTSAKPVIVEEEEEDELAGGMPGTEDDEDNDGSDIVYAAPRKRSVRSTRANSQSRSKGVTRRRGIFSGKVDGSDGSSSDLERPEPTRRSGRTTKASKSMREQREDEEVYADDVATTTAPKVISIREVFQPLSETDPFRVFHSKECDVCGGKGTHSNKGTSPLIHCQGCSTSIHKVCLGYRSGRDHMVTKIDHDDFVMQCRRCIGLAVRKDDSAPRLDCCQSCKEPGSACAAFSKKKTSKQEEKLREENGGQDPITKVSTDLLNNAQLVLFRCRLCQRAYHYEHLPSRAPGKKSKDPDDQDELRELRHLQYQSDNKCKECCEQPAKVQTLVAWRSTDRESYVEGETVDMFREDEKEYLVKWEELSYFKCTWMPGAWVWGVTHTSMRNAFVRRDEGINHLPKWTSEEAIPDDFLRMEIIFDVSYSDDFEPESEEADKQNIGDVEDVLVKFVGLGYEEAVWEARPTPEQTELWSAFVAAYNEYIAGKYFKQLTTSEMKSRIESFRKLDFETDVKVADDEQPSALEGGQLMVYQRTGCNWLLENFHSQKSVILADEMGLGKTIQIIAMIAALVKDNPQCWPFLVVTPNSTCPNWRREIKKWAPSLRVVAYYGGKKARDMAMNYELYPDGCSDMRAHVVVTSYEGPVSDDSRTFFRKIKWAGMIIDEGQRLKNDENLLYVALKDLKVPFRVLLTGTPLQNNTRELFNLLQFIDPSMKAAEMDEKYADLTNENIKELQTLIEPYFMRRTKRDALKFLPPMAQVIVPTTMTVLQKKLYKSILAKNPELIKSIFGQSKVALRPQEKGNLNNILMQLRKVLCHPFMFSTAIEERSESAETMHRNLIDASSKLQLLEIMLPKLKERGHRVLIFSQFLEQLDMIEDFLNGLGLIFGRLDGSVGTLEKQKRIDAFNAPNSPMFAFLLSTRAGGVGINLATADTVIIMDPDFNPHQDIQALSRAHRIGQKNKVLVFQLMTKDSAEEKITQIGRKKMALDHALIETMGVDDDVPVDLESILKHGAEALFNDDDSNDIHYDSASIDKLLDRTQMENTSTDEEKIQESAFSHARIWTNDKLSDDVGDPDAQSSVPDASVWANILKQREADAAAEAAKNVQILGRGKRVRTTIDYHKSDFQLDENVASPAVGHRRRRAQSESDNEFATTGDSDDDDYDAPQPSDVDIRELQTGKARCSSGGSPINKQVDQFRHLELANSDHRLADARPVDFDRTAPEDPQEQGGSKANKGGILYQQHTPNFYESGPNKRVPDIQGPTHQQHPNSFNNAPDPGRLYPGTTGAAFRENLARARASVRHEPQGVLPSNPTAQNPPAFTSRLGDNITRAKKSAQPGQRNGHSTNPTLPDSQSRQYEGQVSTIKDLAAERRLCNTCHGTHPLGQCNLKISGVERCGLCGLAHFGISETCPHLASEVQIRLILDALKMSQEPEHLVETARTYLRGILAERVKRKARPVVEIPVKARPSHTM